MKSKKSITVTISASEGLQALKKSLLKASVHSFGKIVKKGEFHMKSRQPTQHQEVPRCRCQERPRRQTPEERHIFLRQCLVELLADFQHHTGHIPTQRGIRELLRWCYAEKSFSTLSKQSKQRLALFADTMQAKQPQKKKKKKAKARKAFYCYFSPSGLPIVTICLLKKGKEWARGIAICSFSDTFCVNTGKQIARDRAYKALKNKKNTDPIQRELPRPRLVLAMRKKVQKGKCYKSDYRPVLSPYEKRLIAELIQDKKRRCIL